MKIVSNFGSRQFTAGWQLPHSPEFKLVCPHVPPPAWFQAQGGAGRLHLLSEQPEPYSLRPEGCPIASGAVEGACRHLVKDRLERTGMLWLPNGAQAILNLRSFWINDEWDEYSSTTPKPN